MRRFGLILWAFLVMALVASCDEDRSGPGSGGTPDGSLGPPIDLVAAGDRASSANYQLRVNVEPFGGVAQSENYRFECSTALTAHAGRGGE